MVYASCFSGSWHGAIDTGSFVSARLRNLGQVNTIQSTILARKGGLAIFEPCLSTPAIGEERHLKEIVYCTNRAQP
jgi:hypothetical protein